jgi:isoleucyl-tRNA synthetase
MYGEDDFVLGQKYNLPFFHTVNEEGKFSVGEWKGEFVKDADSKIIKKLEERKILKREEKIMHSYPFCWRCDTPLLYYALQTWYIDVTKIKEKLLESNKKIYWLPEHIKDGRFGKWLEGARDWGFSRNRFWGAPIPIWECSSCGEFKCIGSKKELNKELEDLHRPFIDEVVLKCDKCGKEMKRVEEVFDCWFESGSMPYGQWHYPFENKDFVEKTFPADFIAEGIDQTRGWFYTLHVLATALTLDGDGDLGKDKPAFLNAIVNGLIFDAKGKKLSKKLKNYPDMTDVFTNYGADSLRFFLLSSTPIGEDYRFSDDRVRETNARVMATIFHSFSFLSTYGKVVEKAEVKHPLNKWLLARLNETNKKVVEEMEKYNLTKASREIDLFIDDLSNWYIRRSREKIKEGDEEFLFALRHAIISLVKMIAPFAPFLSEYIYKELTGELSIHLTDYPVADEKMIDKKLLEEMEKIREVISMALKERADAGIKVRQPLSSLTFSIPKLELVKDKEEMLNLIKEEVNVKNVVFEGNKKEEVTLDIKITPELKEEGQVREIARTIQNMRKKSGLTPKDKINLFYNGSSFENIFEKNEEHFKKETMIEKIEKTEIENKEEWDVVKIDNEELFLKIEKTE